MHPSGEFVAYAVASGENQTTIYLAPLQGRTGERVKLTDFPASVSRAIDAMSWSRSGRYLVICGFGLVGVIDCQSAKPTLRTFPAKWDDAVLFSDERTLLGLAMNNARTATEHREGEELQKIDLFAEHPSAEALKGAPLVDVHGRPPFFATNNDSVLVAGTNLRVRSDRSVSVDAEWGDNSLYGVTAGPFSLAGRECVIHVAQPARPFGPDEIFVPVETDIDAYSMAGNHIAKIDWPKSERIDSIDIFPNGKVFVQNITSIFVREYQLVPVPSKKK